MKSPFPGMDPYIEARGRWRPFHTRLISRIVDWLEDNLPSRYLVRPEEREIIELVEEEGRKDRSMYPDVGVTGPRLPATSSESSVAVASSTTTSLPLALRAFVAEEFRERFIEITAVEPERRLVTCIEVLSPSNKRPNSESREQYLRKRQALLLGEVNLVEIDLLRDGDKMPMLDPLPHSPFILLVGRWYMEGVCHVWPADFRNPLPPIPIPLDRPDPDLLLDLQPMIASIYERGRYGEGIDYHQPLTPPLSEADQVWIQDLLKQRAGS